MQLRRDFMGTMRDLPSIVMEFLRDHYRYIFPGAIPLPAQQKRVEVAQKRIRALAWFLALTMPSWSILDSFAFEHDLWEQVLVARLLAGAAFASFLLLGERFFHEGESNLGIIYCELATIFAIPTLLNIFLAYLPESVTDLTPFASAIINSYYLLPFVVLACLGFFPLALVESMSVALVLLITYFLSSHAPHISPGAHVSPGAPDLGMGWVMAVLGGISVIISYSQLRMVTQLVSYSSYDVLTDCLGRRSGEEVIKALWHYSIRKKAPFSIAFIDLDHFKRVNDSFGHQVGDSVLANAATAIKNSLRKSDFVTRWGGEEFLVIMPDAKIEDATMVLMRMSERGFGIKPDGTHQTVSIGIAERLIDAAGDEKLLVKAADERLYRAKVAGRCRAMGAEMVLLPQPTSTKRAI